MLPPAAADKQAVKIDDAEEIQEVKKVHEVIYDGDLRAENIFAPSGRFDENLNPFRRDSWNMAEQARIYKDNPEIAKYLMRDAQD